MIEAIFIPFSAADRVITALKEAVPNINVIKVTAQRPGTNDLHITHESATKEHAVYELEQIIGVRRKIWLRSVTALTTRNLFMAVGYRVAMGNAVDSLKAEADMVIEPVNRDGLALYFEQLAKGRSMKFKANTRRKAAEYEKDLVRYWKEHKTFEKSVEQRPQEGAYVFYDGPPFITGVPHHGTLLSSIVKDAVPRYWTMKGRRVERVWGWDCHGLPAEVFTEKKLGIKDRRDIGTTVSIEDYITTCRDNMVQTGDLWESTIERIGRWVDFRGAYKTMDKEYMESVWWAFKELYEKGKIYEGEKVLLYCTRDATPISKAEVAMDNSYQDVTDPSVFVKFKLKGEDVSVLAWTTTPWTLPANTAVAVNENEQYVEVEVATERLILAKTMVDKALTDEKHNVVPYTITRTFPGSELVGRRYEPLFEDRGEKAHRIWHAEYVSMEEGTGIVHLAPAYGEEDYALSREKGFPFVNNIDDNGLYIEGEWQGQNVWEANKPIAKALHERGVVWKIDYIRHSYPHCHRCGTKLMYRAHPSWFMDIAGQRETMLEQNENINWFPGHVKHGRFANTVESAPDWNLSRDRFWATAMPVWEG
ncbi:class I tRNA ligase family protein [Candidatus Saccharibacteria bacterium]|nr:MAG: class I tRNA ligase family protein [Candidatus Saccharibacteria bacterium]